MRVDWVEGRLRNKSPLSESDKSSIASAYYELFKSEMRGNCENCYFDALFEIYLKIKPMGNYILKSGVAFRYGKDIITHLNVTDEAAEWFLAQDATNKRFFHKIGKKKKQTKKEE